MRLRSGRNLEAQADPNRIPVVHARVARRNRAISVRQKNRRIRGSFRPFSLSNQPREHLENIIKMLPGREFLRMLKVCKSTKKIAEDLMKKEAFYINLRDITVTVSVNDQRELVVELYSRGFAFYTAKIDCWRIWWNTREIHNQLGRFEDIFIKAVYKQLIDKPTRFEEVTTSWSSTFEDVLPEVIRMLRPGKLTINTKTTIDVAIPHDYVTLVYKKFDCISDDFAEHNNKFHQCYLGETKLFWILDSFLDHWNIKDRADFDYSLWTTVSKCGPSCLKKKIGHLFMRALHDLLILYHSSRPQELQQVIVYRRQKGMERSTLILAGYKKETIEGKATVYLVHFVPKTVEEVYAKLEDVFARLELQGGFALPDRERVEAMICDNRQM